MTTIGVKTVCPRDCYDTCFITAFINDLGRITSIKGDPENPVTQGFTCARGAKDHVRVYKNRVLYPFIRAGRKPGRRFRRASWGEALDIVVSRLREVIEKYGPEAILHLEYAGNMGLLTWYFPQRLWNAIGASKTDYSICSKSGHEAISLHYGLSYGVLPEELLEMKLIVYWGFNAAVSSPHLWALSIKARRSGAVIAVVDSRRSESARRANIWLNPRPGSDVALAYGIARYLIEHDYIDTKFIEEWTYGYDLFKEEVMKWTPSRVEDVTGVKWSLIEELGDAYGRLKPSATMIGFGFQKSIQGAEGVRAVSLIPALLGLHRGFYYSNSRGWLVDIPYLNGEKLSKVKPRVVSQVSLGRYIERGEFKFIYIYNMNPILTLPDQRALRKGLARGDVFVVVHETHWTETADYADIVLPAPTYLEKDDIVLPYSHPYVRVMRKVIEPLGESRDEIWVMKKLAERLDLNAEWVLEDPWNALARALHGALENGSFDELLQGKVLRLRQRRRDSYQTPTGKIEFYSTIAEKIGFNPLPVQRPLKLGDKDFILLNSATPKYTHTQFQEVYGPIPPLVVINPEDARSLGIVDGDEVELYNEYGRVRVRAHISNDVPRGVLWSPRQLAGLGGEAQNSLVPPTTQEIGGGPIFNSIIVRVQRSIPANRDIE